jgi:hypothetical protein
MDAPQHQRPGAASAESLVMQWLDRQASWAKTGELRPDDPIEIAFELSALSHGLIVLYLGGRVDQSEKQFRTLYQRSFRRYLDGLRP